MSSSEHRDRREPIELEPLPFQPAPTYSPQGAPVSRRDGLPVENPPIPSMPVHQCPNCDYNLTGLTSRRCPECGEEFLLSEARMHAFEQSEGFRRLYHGERFMRVKMYLGIALILFSLWLVNFRPGTLAGALGLHLTFQGLIMLAILPCIGFFSVCYKVLGDHTWEEAIWAAGLVAVIVCLVLVFL